MERPIAASHVVRARFDRARDLLVHDPVGYLGDRVVPGRRRRFVAVLSADIGGVTVDEDVQVEMAAVRLAARSAQWDLTWRAVDHGRLFPTFRGTLELSPHRSSDLHRWFLAARSIIRISGAYSPPLGPIGVFGDGVIGHRLARQSVEGYLNRVAHRIERAMEAEAEAEAESGTLVPGGF